MRTLTTKEFQAEGAEKLLSELKASKEPLTLTSGDQAAVLVDLESYRNLVGELAKIQALEQFDQTMAEIEKRAEGPKK